MTVLKNFVVLNAEMFVGVFLTGGELLLGIVGAQFFNSRKAGSKK
jgi:sorbitol-specific phosphotransferase system component IIC